MLHDLHRFEIGVECAWPIYLHNKSSSISKLHGQVGSMRTTIRTHEVDLFTFDRSNPETDFQENP